MTGVLQVIAASRGAGLVSPSVVLTLTTLSAPSAPYIILDPNGPITVSGGSTCIPPAWYLPTTSGVGAKNWVRLTVNSGSAPDGATANVIYSMNASVSYQWTQSAVGTKTCNATISWYADAGATQFQMSTTFNVTAQRTS